MNSPPERPNRPNSSIVGQKIERRRTKGVADLIDVYVGGRLRLRRTLLGLSQEMLADAVGLTFQQIQKYERGANRMGASRLYDLAQALGVPVSYFFEDMPEELKERAVGSGGAELDEPLANEDGTLTRRETLELVRAYYRIRDESLRKQLFELVKSVSRGDSEI